MPNIEEYGFVNCCQCDISFAMRQEFLDRKKKNHNGFFCPNGHSLFYPSSSEEVDVNKLKEELERLKTDNEKLRKLFAEDNKSNDVLKGLKNTLI